VSKLKVAGSSLLGFLGSVTLGVCATFTIQMNDRLQFVPVNQTVLVGDTVTWTNVGIVPHTSTSGTNKVPSGLWDSGSIGQHGNFSFTFNGPGDYVYYCTPHVLLPQHMQAQITVASPNLPPLVSITNPITGASFASGSVIQIQADASDPDGTVARVDFFANGQPAGSAFSPPYTVAISTLPPGAYALTAVATDNAGASGSSSAVNITVIRGIIPPTVTITNPISGRAFIEGSNVVVEASAVDTDGVVTQVEFFLNNLSVGIVAAPPYAITLSNLALGDYVLSALATDNDGATSSSPAVTFSVITRPDAPRLLEPLPDRTVVVGSNVAFFASADGSPPLFYQWQFNGTNLVERTDDTLTLTNVSTTNAGAYAVVLSNVVGSVTSPPAILTVVLPPDIRPEVTLTSPQNGARFPLSGTVSIIADATDLDGTVAKVQFFLGRDFVTNSIGIVTNAPFRVDLVRLAAGTYFVSAVATDNRDGTGGSPVISFSILQPTEVTLNRKPDGTNLVAGTAITLTATNSTFGTTVTKVEYFDGAVKVGEAASQPYTFVWKPATGLHFVSAMATDDLGQTTNSTPQQVRIFEPDAVLPKVVITNSPPNFTRFDSPEITLAGVASDNTGLDRVEYQINDAAPSAAKGKETWKLTAQLQGGLNTVRVRSIDLAGNISLEAVRFYTYAVRSRLGLTVRGDGRVTPALNGKLLEVGKTYQITARPASGQIFAGWEGSSKGNVLSFRMEPGLSLVATFMPNPFGALAGRYTGLYMSRGLMIRGSLLSNWQSKGLLAVS